MFPGQGSQYVGMGRELFERFAVARSVFEEANDALGESISRLCFAGPSETLQLTENTQPAILTVSVAVLRVLQSEGYDAANFFAGHSLGEYSALVAAACIPFAVAVKIVRARGRYMQQAVPAGTGAMAAVLGATPETIYEACLKSVRDGEECSPANFNSPGQIVIAGHATAVDRAILWLKDNGAKRVIKLEVSAPFHCPLMLPAQEKLAHDLQAIEFADLQRPIVSNTDAAVVRRGAAAKIALVRQVSSPVRWQETIEVLAREHAVNTFIEIGPGKVLSGLIRQTARDVVCEHVEDIASLEKLTIGHLVR
ncbi:MAG: ACP S-malonyltransferase [Pyrinomonadaceae bacterium]